MKFTTCNVLNSCNKHISDYRKVICLVVLIILSSFMTSCDNNMPAVTKENEDPSITMPNKSIPEQQAFVIPDWFNDYPAIIEEYRKFTECLLNEGLESVFYNDIFCAPDNSLGYNWCCMLIETNIWSYRDFDKTKEAFGYALKDLNGDGSTELILLLQDYTVLAVFSSSNGKPQLMDAYWPKHNCAILETGELYTLSSGGAYDWSYTIQQISQNGNELLQIEEYGMTSLREYPEYYKMVDGEMCIINEAEVEKFHERYPCLSNNIDKEITKNSGIEFIPLF